MMHLPWRRALVTAALCAGCGGGGGGSFPDANDAPDAPPPFEGTTIPLTTPDGSFYSAPVAIADQVFAMDVDTGSTTTGVAAAACATCTSAGVSPLYAPGATSTDLHHTASTQYADGSGWSGEIYSDQMSLGAGTPAVPVAFVGITTQSQFFYPGNDYQGILGLGPTELLENNTTSWLDQATQAGATPVVSFEMCDEVGGTMWLGGYDPAAAQSAPRYTPMLPISGQNPFYAVRMADLALGDQSLGFTGAQLGDPIVDTGTTLFYVPLSVENALISRANADPSYGDLFTGALSESGSGCVSAKPGITAADVDAALPPMTLTFADEAGGTFTVSAPATRTYLYDAGGGDFCLAVYDDGGYGALMGDTILRAFVSVFDVGGARMGFAPDVGCLAQKPLSHAVAPVRGPLVEHGHGPQALHHLAR